MVNQMAKGAKKDILSNSVFHCMGPHWLCRANWETGMSADFEEVKVDVETERRMEELSGKFHCEEVRIWQKF